MVWAFILIGDIEILEIDVMLESGIAKLYPYLISLLMSFWRRSGLAEAPLWWPKVRASRTSCFLPSLLMSTNGHSLPSARMSFFLGHKGCRLKTLLSSSGDLNSFTGPNSEFLFASKALLRSNLYLLKIAKFCKAASLESSKLNSGSVGVLQGLLMTYLIILIKLTSQLNDGCSGL